jgi:hypothetical protein
MADETRVMAHDSVCKLETGELYRSLNTLRVEPNAPNPFVVTQNTQQPAPAPSQTNTGNRD